MPGPVAAYDAAIDDDVMNRLSDFLSDKLNRDDHNKVLKILGKEDPDDNDDVAMAGDAKRYYDSVRDLHCGGHLNTSEYLSRIMAPPRPCRPVLGADAADYAKAFPHANRLKG